MSEATAAVGRDEVWIEKYRPRTLDEVVGQEAITSRLSSYVEREDLPHLLFSGPAGVGKCVTGDTPILTNGGVERIEEVVGDVDGFAEPAGDLRVLTFDGSGFQYVEPSNLFSKRADELLKLRTRDGSTLAVTPEHKLLVIGRDGFEWTPADEISVGERIVRPRSIPLPDGRTELDWLSAMDGDRTLVHVTEEFAQEHHIPPEENEVGGKKAVLSGIRQGRDDEEIAAAADLARSTVRDYRREFSRVDSANPSTVCSLGFLRELDVSREQLKQHVTGIQYVSPTNRRSARLTPPWSVTPELATFIGLVSSEASIGRSCIRIYHNDDRLLDRFSELARAIFDINPAEGVQQGVPYRAIDTRTATHFLEACFDLFDGSTVGGKIASTLITADAESRSAFLRAVFDAEAHVSTQGTIELTEKNGDFVTALSYLLSGFGIPTRRSTALKEATNGSGEKREYHVLYVSGAPALARFQEEIGFGVSEKAKRLAEFAEREPNPKPDTIPAQSAVDDLCEALFLPKRELVSDSLKTSNPGRENYRRVVDQVLAAANDRLETAQRVLADLNRQERAVAALSVVPAAWASDRRALVPIEGRPRIGRATGIRSDRLLENSNGRPSPGARRSRDLLLEQGSVDGRPELSHVQEDLKRAITSLDIPFSRIAKGTPLRGTEIINLLSNDDHDGATLARISTVAERVRTEAAKMLDESVFQAIVTLETIASADLYYDEVQAIDRDTGGERVYDLTVPETHNYVGGAVPTVLHNTTAAIAIAREIYGDDWESNFLELNASDERGIDVVRDRIKNFARASFGGFDYRLIFLDEADALTSDAQSALRRTMEQFSHNTRFILSCNYSSRIIDPIQSRCAVFRFSGIPDEAVAARIREIAEAEDIELADDGVDALVYAADGDMRKAINALQAAAVLGDTVDEDAVFTITSTAKPEDIREMVEAALAGDFSGARAVLDDLLTEQGLAGGAVIDQLHRVVWDVDLDDRAAVRLLDRIGEADYRIAEGANERVQLEALLAAIALQAET